MFSIVALALKLAFPGEMTRQTGFNLQSIVHGYLYPYDNAMRELWFIVTLFLLMLLTPVWRFIVKNSQNIVSGGLVVLALYFWHPDVELLCLGKVMSMALWFYMGLVLCRMEVVEKYLEPQSLLTMICGVAVYAIGVLVEWGFLMTTGGIVLSLGFSLLADRYVPKLFCGFRNYTYQIFLMGIFAQIAVKIVFRHVNWPYFPTYLLCMAAGLYVPVIISKIIEKISWRPLSLCVGLRIRE